MTQIPRAQRVPAGRETIQTALQLSLPHWAGQGSTVPERAVGNLTLEDTLRGIKQYNFTTWLIFLFKYPSRPVSKRDAQMGKRMQRGLALREAH